MNSRRRFATLAVAALWLAASNAPLSAHVGSPDVFADAAAGPYRVLVTIRPPEVVPGVADVEVRVASGDPTSVKIVPLPLAGPGAQFAPVPDQAVRDAADPKFFSGQLWMMTAGAWQVRIAISGTDGPGEVSIPVPALPSQTKAMPPGTGVLLSVLVGLLLVGVVSIISASVREGQLDPGAAVAADRVRRGRRAGAVALAAAVIVVGLGYMWWGVEARAYAAYVYKPLEMQPTLRPDGALALRLHDPGWLASRSMEDLVPDHSHLMHLFVVSESLDRLWHLHPELADPGLFTQRAPAFTRGAYRLFGDVVHEDGLPETLVARLETADVTGSPLQNDDAEWKGDAAAFDPARTTARLSDGGQLRWVRDEAPLKARRPMLFRFEVTAPDGAPASDMQLYMGMPGHAAFIRTDFSVFAHVHPSGSMPMTSMQLAETSLARSAGGASTSTAPADAASAHAAHASGATGALPSVVTFPYGFPRAGDYRIFVQVRRGGRIETGAFDARVSE